MGLPRNYSVWTCPPYRTAWSSAFEVEIERVLWETREKMEVEVSFFLIAGGGGVVYAYISSADG